MTAPHARVGPAGSFCGQSAVHLFSQSVSRARSGPNISPGREQREAAPVESADGRATSTPNPLLPVWEPRCNGPAGLPLYQLDQSRRCAISRPRCVSGDRHRRAAVAVTYVQIVTCLGQEKDRAVQVACGQSSASPLLRSRVARCFRSPVTLIALRGGLTGGPPRAIAGAPVLLILRSQCSTVPACYPICYPEPLGWSQGLDAIIKPHHTPRIRK